MDERAALNRLDVLLPDPRTGFVRASAIAFALVSLAVLVWEIAAHSLNSAQFVTFFAAVILAASLGGTKSGLVAVVLSTASWWVFIGPAHQPAPPEGAGLAALALFLFVSSIVAVAIGTLRLALAESRRAQQGLETWVRQRTEELQDANEKLRLVAGDLEQAISLRTRELERSKNLLASVIEGIPDAVILLEGSGGDLRCAYVNSAAELILGRQREKLLGRRDIEVIDPVHAAENRQVLESGRPLVVRERFLDTSEGQGCFEVRKFPIALGKGSGTALLAIIRNITELRRLEDSLRQRERMDALGQLTGGIAHDFNNLLAIAIGNLDLLEDDAAFGAEEKELVDSARNACLRGAELTSRLLAFARRQTLQPVRTNINELIAEYGKLLQRLLGAHIDLRLQLADDLWHATVDRGQLEAAITNLATNARDAMAKGGKLIISTRNEILETSYTASHAGLAAGEYIAIEFVDTGEGMTPDVQARAIEPFFTTKAEGRGTGLGLSMVFGFAKQSGGHVRIYSEAGQGTTVTLLLPRTRKDRSDKATHKRAVPCAAAGESILVVDDNASLLRVAVNQLAGLGYKVLSAFDGPMALRILGEHGDIDLLLTDIIMPGAMSGTELAREARRLRPDLKVIYMSGFPESAFDEDAQLDPDVVLLRKPFRKAELAENLREVLDKK